MTCTHCESTNDGALTCRLTARRLAPVRCIRIELKRTDKATDVSVEVYERVGDTDSVDLVARMVLSQLSGFRSGFEIQGAS